MGHRNYFSFGRARDEGVTAINTARKKTAQILTNPLSLRTRWKLQIRTRGWREPVQGHVHASGDQLLAGGKH